MTDNDLQQKAQDLVGREVIYCVSTLIYELREVAEKLDDYDTYIELCSGVPDYEEAAWQKLQESDPSELWEMLEELDNAADLLEKWQLMPTDEELAKFAVADGMIDEDEDDNTWMYGSESADTPLALIELSDELRAEAFEGFFNAAPAHYIDVVRKHFDGEIEDYEEFCREHDVDTEDYQREVFEHWLVTEWLGRKLTEKGEVVREYMGLTVWGRTTTGQSISIDGVIEEIVKELEAA